MSKSNRILDVVYSIQEVEKQLEQMGEGWSSNISEWQAVCDPGLQYAKELELEALWANLKEIVAE